MEDAAQVAYEEYKRMEDVRSMAAQRRGERESSSSSSDSSPEERHLTPIKKSPYADKRDSPYEGPRTTVHRRDRDAFSSSSGPRRRVKDERSDYTD